MTETITTPTRAVDPAGRRVPHVLAVVTAGLLAVAAATWLLGWRPADEVAAIAAARRGGHLVTLVVAVSLVVTAGRGRRGDVRAWGIATGLLLATVYLAAFDAFEPVFTERFLLDVAVFLAAVAAAVAALATTAPERTAMSVEPGVWSRWAAGILVVVAAASVGTWVAASVGHALGGAVPEDVLPVPEWRAHVGVVMDLGIIGVGGLVAGVLLWRRTPWGYALALPALTALLVTQVVWAAATASLAAADVAGADTFSPAPLVGIALAGIPWVLAVRRTRTAPH